MAHYGIHHVEKEDHRLASLKLNREHQPTRRLFLATKNDDSRFKIYKLLTALETDISLYISDLHINANLPWWRWRSREKDEHHICRQILKELHSFGMSNKQRWLDAGDSGDFYDLAFLFILIIHFKNTLEKNFNILGFTWIWRQKWSNNFLNSYEIEYDFPVKLHVRAASEPVFWQYIASVLFRTCKSIKDFLKYLSGYMDGMTHSAGQNAVDKDRSTTVLKNRKIARALFFLITESLCPKLLELGLYGMLIKVTQLVLGSNIFGASGVNHFCTLSGYKELAAQTSASANILALAGHVSRYVSLPSLQNGHEDLSRLDALKLEKQSFEGELLEELILRILDIFGCHSIDRLPSSSRWYNFVKALPRVNELHGHLLLMLSHLVIYEPESLVYPKLLIQEMDVSQGGGTNGRNGTQGRRTGGQAESRSRILKTIMRMHYGVSAIWTAFLTYNEDLKAISDAMRIFPYNLPLYGLYIYRGVLANESVEEIFQSLSTKFKLDLDKVKWDLFAINDTHAVARVTAVCIAWLYKHRSIEGAPFLHLLSEFDVKLIVKMLEGMYKTKGILKHLEALLRHHPNSEAACLAYTRSVLETSTRDRLKRTLGTELIQARRPRSLRQLDRFFLALTGRLETEGCKEPIGMDGGDNAGNDGEKDGVKNGVDGHDIESNIHYDELSIFEVSSMRLGILTRLGVDYQLLKNLTSTRIPFGISTRELRKCAEDD